MEIPQNIDLALTQSFLSSEEKKYKLHHAIKHIIKSFLSDVRNTSSDLFIGEDHDFAAIVFESNLKNYEVTFPGEWKTAKECIRLAKHKKYLSNVGECLHSLDVRVESVKKISFTAEEKIFKGKYVIYLLNMEKEVFVEIKYYSNLNIVEIKMFLEDEILSSSTILKDDEILSISRLEERRVMDERVTLDSLRDKEILQEERNIKNAEKEILKAEIKEELIREEVKEELIREEVKEELLREEFKNEFLPSDDLLLYVKHNFEKEYTPSTFRKHFPESRMVLEFYENIERDLRLKIHEMKRFIESGECALTERLLGGSPVECVENLIIAEKLLAEVEEKRRSLSIV